MACCAFAVWMTRLLWRGVLALGDGTARLLGRHAADREPAPAAPTVAGHGQFADR
jgi:hypothetical protein